MFNQCVWVCVLMMLFPEMGLAGLFQHEGQYLDQFVIIGIYEGWRTDVAIGVVVFDIRIPKSGDHYVQLSIMVRGENLDLIKDIPLGTTIRVQGTHRMVRIKKWNRIPVMYAKNITRLSQ